MYRLKIIVLLLLISSSCFCQDIKDVYLIFKNNEQNHYFKSQFRFSKKDGFIIKENSCVKTINKDSTQDLNVITFKEFLNECSKKGMKYIFDPNLLYKNIYILEDYNETQFLVFEVKWKALYID